MNKLFKILLVAVCIAHVGSSQASFLAKRFLTKPSQARNPITKRNFCSIETQIAKIKNRGTLAKGVCGAVAGVSTVGISLASDYIIDEAIFNIRYEPGFLPSLGLIGGLLASGAVGGPAGVVSYSTLFAATIAARQHDYWK